MDLEKLKEMKERLIQEIEKLDPMFKDFLEILKESLEKIEDKIIEYYQQSDPEVLQAAIDFLQRQI